MAAESKTKHYVNVFLRYFVLILVGLIMIYPLVWMVGATFKSNAEIFSSIGFIPKNPTLEGYKKAMESYGGAINVWKAMLNTFSYVIPKVVFTMISATVTAYGFGRFEFKGRGILFSVLMATLFLPQVVLNVPQFIMFSKMGWVDSKLYLPIIVPTLFATDTLFVFQLIQFLRNVPKELDEAAKIDGATKTQALRRITIPMVMPSFTICLFLTLTNSFKLFDQNLALTAGGPGRQTSMLALDIYSTFYGRVGWEGVGQAKAVVFFIMVAVIALTQLYITRRKEVEN